MEEKRVLEFLRMKGDFLYHREGQELEFKEQYNFAGLADYFRDFAGFANNRGGYIIFGIQDSPRIPIGLTRNSIDQFNRIDPERITGFLLEIFSSDIRWEQILIQSENKQFAVFTKGEGEMFPGIPEITRHQSIFEKGDALLEEIKAFLYCIQNDTIPMVTGEEGLDALKTAANITHLIQQNLAIHHAM